MSLPSDDLCFISAQPTNNKTFINQIREIKKKKERKNHRQT
jgi:hypothetical protein